MIRELILTPKLKRAFRKFVRRNAKLKEYIESTLIQMEEDVFEASLSTNNPTFAESPIFPPAVDSNGCTERVFEN